jgi:hypothetical protein
MSKNKLLVFLAVVMSVSLACGLFGSGSRSSDEVFPSEGGSTPGEAPPSSGSNKYDTEFPMPSSVENFMNLGDSGINYQTSLSLDEVVAFYRDAFENAGYSERSILTSIEDKTFSIVWDGHPSGQAIVVQGVDLENGTVNVNVRFEDV